MSSVPELTEYQSKVMSAIANSHLKTFIVPSPALAEEKEAKESLAKNLAELEQLVSYGLLMDTTAQVNESVADDAKGKFRAFTIEYEGVVLFKDSGDRGVN